MKKRNWIKIFLGLFLSILVIKETGIITGVVIFILFVLVVINDEMIDTIIDLIKSKKDE